MIEVLFGESEAASMKAAKGNAVEIIGGNDNTTSYIGNLTDDYKQKIEWIPGTSKEVICFGFMLDVGEIKETIDSKYRQDLIFSMYTQNGWDNSPEVLEELSMVGKQYVNEWERLIEFLDKGESIRIWYSDSPYSLCGYYFLCNQLRTYSNDIYVVKLPEYIQYAENTITRYSNWGEVSAEGFYEFLSYEKKLTVAEKRMFGTQWSELVEDNNPLRAVINRQLVGVEEDFYDFFIRKCISKRPVKEARLIGDILGYYPIGIGDWWYALRIENMIHDGSIRIIENSEHKYSRLICLA